MAGHGAIGRAASRRLRDRRTDHVPGNRTRARTISDGGYLVRGLVDIHAHRSLHSPAGDAAPAEQRVRAAQLAAGVSAGRAPASPDRASQQVGGRMKAYRGAAAGGGWVKVITESPAPAVPSPPRSRPTCSPSARRAHAAGAQIAAHATWSLDLSMPVNSSWPSVGKQPYGPCRSACAAASARVVTPSLPKMLLTWCSTVRLLM